MIDKNSRILVTGGHGFLGTHLIEHLKNYGYNCIIAPKHEECDLMHQKTASDYFRSCSPDAVIHLAAVVGGIGANQDNPGKFFYENMQIGLNAMHFAYKYGCEKFINIGTVCAYPKIPKTIPFVEEELWDGFPEETNAPYGIAKRALMLMGQVYRKQYGFNCITLIPTNLYGPNDNFSPRVSHVIPAIIRKVGEAQKNGLNTIDLWGTGNATREFLYVVECAKAIRLAMKYYDQPEPVNLGSGQEISIYELAHLICTKMNLGGGNYQINYYSINAHDGQPKRRVNNDRAYRQFGFQNQMTLDNGLDKTIKWWRNNHG